MKEIIFVAPYESMYNVARSLIEKRGYKNVDVVLGDLKDGLEQAYAAVEKGANVVISRGGTFKMIKKELRAPVVELKVSVYDVLNSIKHIVGKNEGIAILGYNNIIYGYDLLKDMLGINILKIDILDNDNLVERIKECLFKGIHTFMGDAIVNTVCQRLGYQCYMIESGEDSIGLAIEEATNILEAYKNELARAKRYEVLIDCVHDGIIATDDKDRITVFNRVAQDIFQIGKERAIGKKVEDLLWTADIARDVSQGKAIVDGIRTIQGDKFTFSNIPINVNGYNKGSVAILQNVAMVQNLEREIRTKLMEKGFIARYTFDSIVHKSEEIKQCIKIAKKFSQYDSSVLIEGPSGVGKELFAQSIHNESRRRGEPFVAVNCAALPSTLIESELFGYVEGAFTGSKKGGKAGVFELAHKGTIFLDEISEIPPEIQGRLLRVIQEREIMRVGDNKVLPLDIRIICATNRDLGQMVEEGTFRRDLLYRINTLYFDIPKLNDRKKDIEALANFFLDRYSKNYSKDIKELSPKALEYLLKHDYRGNVRELQGMIERAVIVCETNRIGLEDFTAGKKKEEDKTSIDNITKNEESEAIVSKLLSVSNSMPSLKEVEEYYINMVYDRVNKSTSKACEILKVHRSTLWRMVK